ncbi:Asp-tRNA(Asn)/Glu-tRNA(Gln) amidotransferase subunit GatC [bacterium]|nr:Asp-tRNA(Asn)/Glu-tRNA(Gln) amidotransferase subunit GatC [bacterium]
MAKLSRIKLSQKELEKFTPQMKTILESVDVLQEVDTAGIKPMKKRVSFSDLREDIATISLTQEEVLRNANHTEMNLVKIYGKIF